MRSPPCPRHPISVPRWNRLDVGVRYLTAVQGRLVTLRARIDNLTHRNTASSGGHPDSATWWWLRRAPCRGA